MRQNKINFKNMINNYLKNKINPTVRVTSNLLMIYGIASIGYAIYFLFSYLLGALTGSILDYGYFFIIGLLYFAGYIFVIIMGSLMLFQARKQLVEGRSSGSSLGIAGLFFAGMPVGFILFNELWVTSVAEFYPPRIFILYILFNLILISLLLYLNRILKKRR